MEAKAKAVMRTEQIWLGGCKTVGELCHLSKNLYNEANYIIRQEFFETGKWIQYNTLAHLMKDSENYKALPVQTAQQILILLERSWKSFFKAIKTWKKHPEKFKERPKLPGYKNKEGKHILLFTNQQAKLRDGWLLLPKKVGLKIKTRIKDGLREARVIPKGAGYVLEIVYKKVVEVVEKNKERIAGIDLGAKNIVTIANNIGVKPIIVKDDGNGIKSINQFYSKKKAELQAVYDLQGIKNGAKLRSLRTKRNRKGNDWIHKLARFIVDWCVKHGIGTIIFGYNENWKQNVNIGRRNNQTFTGIPYMDIIHKTRYKAEEEGIEVKEQEESHTSKCSFLDNEPVEHHEEYVGKRKTRSFFRSKSGARIHADVNAAYNIIEKGIPGAIPLRIREWIRGCGLHPMRCNLNFNLNASHEGV